jgi:HEPN domain-containing protein
VPQGRPIPGSPQAWLARARGDLAPARAPLPEEGFYVDLCFHAQQAAEKALKALYLSRGWAFQYIHDLEALITGLRQYGLAVPVEIDPAVVLTSYAFEARYPGLGEPVTEEEYSRR